MWNVKKLFFGGVIPLVLMLLVSPVHAEIKSYDDDHVAHGGHGGGRHGGYQGSHRGGGYRGAHRGGYDGHHHNNHHWNHNNQWHHADRHDWNHHGGNYHHPWHNWYWYGGAAALGGAGLAAYESSNPGYYYDPNYYYMDEGQPSVEYNYGETPSTTDQPDQSQVQMNFGQPTSDANTRMVPTRPVVRNPNGIIILEDGVEGYPDEDYNDVNMDSSVEIDADDNDDEEDVNID